VAHVVGATALWMAAGGDLFCLFARTNRMTSNRDSFQEVPRLKSRITLLLTLNLTLAAIAFADNRKMSQLTQTTAPSLSSEASSPLQDIAWMVGSWESDDMEVEASVDWTQGQKFLIRRFNFRRTDGQQTAGWEVIGWDSETQEIRSWVFDSDGGFGDRFWTEEGKGNRWQIEAVNTLPDGSQSTAVHVITKVDDDHYTWESGNRSADGLLLPSITVARVGKHNNRRP
jgi:hypothetical protein